MAVNEEQGNVTAVETKNANGPSPAVEVKKATTKQAVNTKPAESIGGFCVYIGPSIRGVIQAGTVYGMTKEQAISKLAPSIEKHPLIRELIVPGDVLAVDRVKVKTKGNLLNVQYEKLAASQESK